VTAFPGTVAAVEYGGPWELPPVGELFNFPYFPGTEGWWPLAINRTAVFLLLSALLIGAFFFVAFSDAKVVPNRLQAAAESLVDFIRDRIAVEIIGPEGHKFVPLLTTLFLFIFLNNLFKITPGIMFPPTSRMAIPGFLAITVWFVFIGVGIKEHGFGRYMKETLVPPAPKAILPILVPIEFISNILLRPFTLAIRLFANMVAGHILVVITLITVHAYLVWGPGLPLGIFALFPLSPIVFGFEFFIISLQAYIFTMLAAVYIGSSIHAGH
jgi:F-type H+-transporting ATPase subunit a